MGNTPISKGRGQVIIKLTALALLFHFLNHATRWSETAGRAASLSVCSVSSRQEQTSSFTKV